MPVIAIDDLSDPRLGDYRHVPDPELLRRGDIFVAEGRLVVRALLASPRLTTRSLLVTEAALAALRDLIELRLPALDVFLVPARAIEALTGFNIHRGCLAIGERPAPLSIDALLSGGSRPRPGFSGDAVLLTGGAARTLVVLEQVGNADNVGAVFRNAAAFGVDAVILGPNCCDPLYRKAIRVSMGTALRVPFIPADTWPGVLGRLREHGFTVAALTPRPEATPLDRFAAGWLHGGRLALLAGSEGDGLSDAALEAASVPLRIPLAPGVDSLNVATAVAVALYALREVD